MVFYFSHAMALILIFSFCPVVVSAADDTGIRLSLCNSNREMNGQ